MDINWLRVYDLTIEFTRAINFEYCHIWYDYQHHIICLPFITIYWQGAPYLDIDE